MLGSPSPSNLPHSHKGPLHEEALIPQTQPCPSQGLLFNPFRAWSGHSLPPLSIHSVKVPWVPHSETDVLTRPTSEEPQGPQLPALHLLSLCWVTPVLLQDTDTVPVRGLGALSCWRPSHSGHVNLLSPIQHSPQRGLVLQVLGHSGPLHSNRRTLTHTTAMNSPKGRT